MREVKIVKRTKYPVYDYPLSPQRRGLLAKTPKPCSSSWCCGNKRATEGPTIQELKHDSN